jgi:hypothetical protein
MQAHFVFSGDCHGEERWDNNGGELHTFASLYVHKACVLFVLCVKVWRDAMQAHFVVSGNCHGEERWDNNGGELHSVCLSSVVCSVLAQVVQAQCCLVNKALCCEQHWHQDRNRWSSVMACLLYDGMASGRHAGALCIFWRLPRQGALGQQRRWVAVELRLSAVLESEDAKGS